ncbi:MAG: hypothetical protein LBD78_05765 [Spirochaetaceae bacterium]|jgi:hypothetical protein|nr:hypothetical protein [Spirochaetaceae bacterium]
MRKLIALSIVLTVLASAVFAQDTGLVFSGWGRAVFAPIRVVDPAEGDSKTYTGVGRGWFTHPHVGVNLTGDWENIGVQADLVFNDEGKKGVAIGDHAYIWAKPWDFLRLNVGKFADGTLWGKIGGTNFDYGVTLAEGGEADIFERFVGNGLGAEVILTPIEGLYIAALVNAGHFPENSIEAKYAFQKIHIGAGYEIADIGHARVQFIGNNGTVDTTKALEDFTKGDVYQADASRVELAFALTAVENLTVDLGAKIWFPATKGMDVSTVDDDYDTIDLDDTSYTNPFGLSVGAKYTLDSFGITARVDTKIGAKYKENNIEGQSGLYLNAHLVPSYNLGFATIGADVGFQVNPKITGEQAGTSYTLDEGGVGFGLGAWIQKDFGNGLIKTGIGVTLPTVTHKLKPIGVTTASDTKQDMVLTIPVIMEYWF